jgi:serine protease Do
MMWSRLSRPLFALSLLAFCLPPAAAQQPAPAGRVGPESFAPLIKRVLPTVVNIATTETVGGADPFASLPPEIRQQLRERFRVRREQVRGAGSGFIIDADGTIVTNNHVVGTADRIVVSLSDGTQLPAKVIGTDELTDVAVIRVASTTPLIAAHWGDSRTLEVGDWVIAAGNPFGLGGSVSAGIVSARGRDLGAGPFDDFVQIDAPINPGNSGGPLFNASGEVVGMNSAILSPSGGSVGIGFSIPSEVVSQVVAELRAKGHIERGWLGVTLADIEGTQGNAGIGGVGIAVVERGGPAARGGLRPGDIVTAVNGLAVTSTRAMIRAVAATPPGGTVRLALRRQGSTLDLSITVGQRPKTKEN